MRTPTQATYFKSALISGFSLKTLVSTEIEVKPFLSHFGCAVSPLDCLLH